MKNNKFLLRLFAFVIASVMTLSVTSSVFATGVTENNNNDQADTQNESTSAGGSSTQTNGSVLSYLNYSQMHSDAVRPSETIIINKDNITDTADTDIEILDSYADSEGKSLNNVIKWTNEDGYITFTFEVKKAGNYNMSMLYCPVELKSRDIEINLLIDGKTPFSEASKLLFKRVWKDEGKIEQDKFDNDIKPNQIEHPIWIEDNLRDKEGFLSQDYLFYFSEGTHTMTVKMVREAAAIAQFKLYRNAEIPSYSDVKAEYDKNGYKVVENYSNLFEAENATLKSDSILYARNDRTSPITWPYHWSKTKLNTIGQANWNLTGMWVSYDFEVPEDGLYAINFRAKQTYQIGMATNRTIYIDGEVPFAEMQSVSFPYEDGWYTKKLEDEKGQPYLFYLTAGKHSLKIETTVGDLGSILSEVDDITYKLNAMYRQVIMITSTDPDQYRDYKLDKQIPGLVDTLKEGADRLYAVADKFNAMNDGKLGEQSALLIRIGDLLTSFVNKMDEFPNRVGSFREGISSLSSWILARKEQPLELDCIEISTPGTVTRKAKANFFEGLLHGIRAFWASFFTDYNQISEEDTGAIKVWIWGGRDQAQIINTMTSDMFVAKEGIKVNISLVQAGLIEAILAGKAPDIALGIGRGEPVNLACREALIGLKDFEGFDEVTKRFAKTAMTPYEYNGDYYALPCTNTFPMLFYRTDIFNELGLKYPNTWEEMNDIIPILQRNNMSIGLPYGMMYSIFLLQNGGNYYNEEKNQTRFDETVAIESFQQWTDFYSKFSFDLEFDFYNRFRSGEMPIGIADYTLYNQFSVAAPEIRNQWQMVPVPGTYNDEGELVRTTGAGGTCMVITKQAKDKEACWKFLSFWTDTEAQTRFGRELESLLGAAGRYATANLEAFENLPWNKKETENLLNQWGEVNEIAEVVGGYYTDRELTFKFRNVIYDHYNTREALYQANENINNEINRKRKELGLSVYNSDKD